MQRLARVLGAVLLFQVLIKLSLQDLYSGFWIVRGFRTSNDKVSAACWSVISRYGFSILAISDEEVDKVTPFLAERKITYPVMLDGGKVHQQFQVEGIPKSFVYDRNGKLVAQSIDMRTRKQFMEMLELAGLR